MSTRKKKSCRVWVVQHADGSVTGILMRQWNAFFDAPPPSAFGRSIDDVLDALDVELKRRELAGAEPLERYLWAESFTVHTVDIDFHPQTFIDKRPVIGADSFPLTLAYAACRVHDPALGPRASQGHAPDAPATLPDDLRPPQGRLGGPFRVGLPRYGWWLMLESLDMAKDAIGLQLGAALMGEKTSSILDFRRDGRESVREFMPRLVTLDDAEDDLAETHPTAALVTDELVDRARRGLLPAPYALELDSLLARRVNAVHPLSIVLVGPPGVGKTAQIRLLAHKLGKLKQVGRRKRRLFSTSRDRLLAGMTLLGQWEERVLHLIEELRGRGDMLHIDRLHTLLEPMADGGSVGDLFLPAVAGREIGIIAEATPEELARLRQKHPRWFDHLRVLAIRPMADANLATWVSGYAENAELARARREPDTRTTRTIAWTADGLARLVDLQRTFEPHTAQPGKATRFITWWLEAGSNRDTPLPRMDESTVAATYARYQRLPESLVAGRGRATDHTLRQLETKVIGQPEACEIAAKIVARFRAGLCDPGRPLGTLLFVGPTGVGKTELAKALTEVAFSSAAEGDVDPLRRMCRLDMSEFHMPWSVDRLIQVGPGVTSLAERVRQEPISLVLFDEIEKAHPAVFDLLLGVLDEGRLTDQNGISVDFRMTLIVMTSNVGAGGPRSTGFFGAPTPDYRAAIARSFRPEFINRLDHIVPFSPLSEAAIEQILDLEIEKLSRREGFVRRGLTITLDPDTRQKVIAAGFHPEYGARSLRRAIEDLVVAPLARELARA